MFEAMMTPIFAHARPWLIPSRPASDARLRAMRRQWDAALRSLDDDQLDELFAAAWRSLDEEERERFERIGETLTRGDSRP